MGIGEGLPCSLGCQGCPPVLEEREPWLAMSQKPELWALPGAGKSPGPQAEQHLLRRATLSALSPGSHYLQPTLSALCITYCLGALSEPEIAQSRPEALLWPPPCPLFTPAFRKGLSNPELGEARGPGSCPLEGKGTHTLGPHSSNGGCHLLCIYYV